MSNSTPDTGNALSSGNAQDVVTTKRKITAAQIGEECPACLQEIGEEIAKRFNEAQKHAKLLDDQVIELMKLFAEAEELCDRGGFNAFREKFFPNLRKSRVYEWLAIASNRKSIEETKASTRERVAKHRANKAEPSVSVTATEKSQPEVQGAPPEDVKEAEGPFSVTVTEEPDRAPTDDGNATSILPEQALEPAKLRRGRAPAVDEALRDFSARVQDLDRRTDKKPAQRFAGTTVPADKLARLGKLLTDLANLKKSDAAKPSRCYLATVSGWS
jgi:hypothetical protein